MKQQYTKSENLVCQLAEEAEDIVYQTWLQNTAEREEASRWKDACEIPVINTNDVSQSPYKEAQRLISGVLEASLMGDWSNKARVFVYGLSRNEARDNYNMNNTEYEACSKMLSAAGVKYPIGLFAIDM